MQLQTALTGTQQGNKISITQSGAKTCGMETRAGKTAAMTLALNSQIQLHCRSDRHLQRCGFNL